jgi:hypothetical protein
LGLARHPRGEVVVQKRFASKREATPPCGVPLLLAIKLPCSIWAGAAREREWVKAYQIQPAELKFGISAKVKKNFLDYHMLVM